MTLADVIAAMRIARCSLEQVERVSLELTQLSLVARKARNHRYYLKSKTLQASELTKTIKTSEASEIKTFKTSYTSPSPSPKKEKVSPTPPLKEKTPLLLPLDSLADARLVIEKADDGVMCRLKDFGQAWNTLAGQFKLPQIAEIKSGSMRERHALARLRDLESHDDLLNHIRGSPYLRGEVNGFRATFDWIINVSNCQKIMDGNYEARQERSQGVPYRGTRS